MTAIATMKEEILSKSVTVYMPSNIQVEIMDLMRERKGYIQELNNLNRYCYDEFTRKKVESEVQRLENAKKTCMSQIEILLLKHCKGIKIDPNPDVTIGNILAVLPEPQHLRLATYVNARGNPVQT